MSDLESFLDQCFDSFVMGKTKENTTPAQTSKRTRSESSPGASGSPEKGFSEILESIDKKLSSFDARLFLVEVLHKEFGKLRESLEFSQAQVTSLAAENQALRGDVKDLTEQVTRMSGENKKFKESILDLQSRSMRDNLVFSGIPEREGEDAEVTVRNFIEHQLKLPSETVRSITFDRVHRIGARRSANSRSRAMVVKFQHYKQKMQVIRQGRELRGTEFSVNDQFPKEILDRRRVLFPIRKKFISEGARASVSVDRLYVNGQLYREPDVTPWLY